MTSMKQSWWKYINPPMFKFKIITIPQTFESDSQTFYGWIYKHLDLECTLRLL